MPAIARAELYGADPRLTTIYKWARALEVDPSELLPSVEVYDLAAEIDAALAATSDNKAVS